MLITANFGTANTGLPVYYTLLNADKTVAQARTATGVTELSVGSGNYGVTVADATLAGKTILWDIDGTAKTASETFPYSASGGSGAISTTITVTRVDTGAPIDGVEVWISTDSAGTNVIAGTVTTDGNGYATFMLDAGTYYVWKQANGMNFTNPQSITVVAP